MPDVLVRALADDTAVVTLNLSEHAQLSMSIFREFACISNQLNIGKAVIIPLWESSAQAVKNWLRQTLPDWSEVEVAWHAKYLGFIIGPERADNSWKKASAKFTQRVVARAFLRLGMYMNASVYRSFCMSLFSFLWQLEDIPTEVLHLETWALRRLAPGPGNWLRLSTCIG